MGVITAWWRQPDHYDWLSSYLHARGFTRPAQILMACIGASGALVPANALWGPESNNHAVGVGLGIGAGVAGIAYAILWLTRWPSRYQSIGFALTIAAAIGIGSWTAVNPVLGLMSCAALAVSGGYLAFFHTARLVTVNLVIALGMAAHHALSMAADGQAILALSMYFIVLELNAGVPLAIQIVVHALGIDLIRSDRDPLTGLLNRRSFEREVIAALLDGQRRGSFLAFAMIDLDRFKALNDTLGHSVGDQALAAVGHALQSKLPESAIVGRVGGEEFLVADIVDTAVPDALGENAKQAIISTPYHLTGSVGTASVATDTIDITSIADILHRLTTQADVAMYRAKRAGGNRVRHHAFEAFEPLEAFDHLLEDGPRQKESQDGRDVST
jgi:diguanylate cyclase (GGDEF)-like protein